MKKDITLIISGTLIIITFIIVFAVIQLSSAQTISVTGESQIDAIPDVVTINFNIETKASTASEAQNQNNEIYNKLVSFLTIQGFSESEIKTINFNVYPEYDWNSGQQSQKGYIAQHSVKIELLTEESEKITAVIDAGIDAGALINYINFELSEELQKEKKFEAIQTATEDAKIRAESIAQGLGKNLGRIVSITDSGFNYYPWPLYERGESITNTDEAGSLAKSATMNINPSEQVVYGSVSVIYKIR